MPYIEQTERKEKVADVAVRLLAQPDFRLLCEAWISDLVDKHDEILALDGTALTRAQGAATELKAILNAIYGAANVAERVAMFRASRVQQGRSAYLDTPFSDGTQA